MLHLLSDFEARRRLDPADRDPNYRLWEIAGTAHADYFIGYQSVFGHGPRVADQRRQWTTAEYDEHRSTPPATTARSSRPTAGDVHRRRRHHADALRHVDRASTSSTRWVRTGERRAGQRPALPVRRGGQLAKDEHGNTLGGIRLPPIDVPVARYAVHGLPARRHHHPVHRPADRRRSTRPTPTTTQLMRAATDRAVAAGWLLPEDAVDLMRRVCAVRERYPAGSRGAARTTGLRPSDLPDTPAWPDTPAA